MEYLLAAERRPAAQGEIAIGSFRETFFSPLDVWQCEDYERQWQNATQRLRIGAVSSCFVVGVHPASIAQYIHTYAIWRLPTQFRAQELTLSFENSGTLDPRSPYHAIPAYRNVTEDGEVISDDWGLPLDEFDKA
jgi:hypothetical protein